MRRSTAPVAVIVHPERRPQSGEAMATLTVPTTARPWIERLARAGYLAKGVVYLLIGILALQAAAGAGGRTTGTTGAFRVLLRQPLGHWLLWLGGVRPPGSGRRR